jgi:hypothetical protein
VSLGRDRFEQLSKAYTLIVGSDIGLVRRSHEEAVAQLFSELQKYYYIYNIAVLDTNAERDSEFVSGVNLTVGQMVFVRSSLTFQEWSGSAWVIVLQPVAPSTLVDPTTAVGDLIARGSVGLVAVAIGPEGTVLTSIGGFPAWTTIDGYTKAQADARFAPIGLVAIVAALPLGGPVRGQINFATGLVVSGSTETGVVHVGAGDSDLVDIVANTNCWIRFYGSADDAVSDAARLITADPVTPVLAEFILNTDVKVLCDPYPSLIERGAVSTGDVWYAITNLVAGTFAIIVDSFATAGAALLTAYVPPGVTNYTGFTTNGAANDWVTIVGLAKTPTSSGAERVARIKELLGDRAILAQIGLRRGGATTFYNAAGFSFFQPDAAVDDNNGFGAAIYSGAFPLGATLACQIVQYNTPGVGRVIVASGASFTLAPGVPIWLQMTLTSDGKGILLESSLVSIAGPWTAECGWTLTAPQQTIYLDGTHRHGGILGATADFAGTEWLVEDIQFKSTLSQQVAVTLTRVRIEP